MFFADGEETCAGLDDLLCGAASSANSHFEIRMCKKLQWGIVTPVAMNQGNSTQADAVT